MLDPARLLDVSKLLVGVGRKGAPSQVFLRRAVSTAYYAVFHALVGRSKRRTTRYSLLYRAFEHGRMREICENLDKDALGKRAKSALGVSVLDQDLREVAATFVFLQQQRHWADYAPQGRTSRADVADMVDQAEVAIARLTSANAERKANVLVYLLTSARE